LIELGLGEALQSQAVVPEAIHMRSGRSGREIVCIPLGRQVESSYGAPYWVIHRADLQRVLLEAVANSPDIVLRLGFNVLDHASHANGVTVAGKTASGVIVEEHGLALVGADGLWSSVRLSLGHKIVPRFRQRTAWRTVVPAADLEPGWRTPATQLWLGARAHLVHYPVYGGAAVNIVAIVEDKSELRGWNNAGQPEMLLRQFARWPRATQAILAAASGWQTWSLYDLPPLPQWGRGPVTLLGDAAHATLPYLAQGGAMAIEDAAVLAGCAMGFRDHIPGAFRAYEGSRQSRTRKVARASARTGTIYHLRGPFGWARNYAMQMLGDDRLLRRQEWLYAWKNIGRN
jgi:salicylate hydroxylase